jgi:peptidoglycan/LPS O-acetylase OafA/YrhL
MNPDISTSIDSTSVRAGRLPEIDGWRAGILLVIVFHILESQHLALMSRHPFLQEWLHDAGPVALDMFFVISGFVIFRLLISEELRFGSVSLKRYYYRRIFRILPPFYVYLAVLFALCSLGLIHESRRETLFAGLFLQDLHLISNGWFTGHAWTLAVEEQFYLLFPFIWVIAPKRFRNLLFLAVFFLCSAWNLSLLYTGWDVRISSVIRGGFACISFGVLMAIYETRARSIANRVPAFLVSIVFLILLIHPVPPRTWQALVYESFLTPAAIGLVLLFSLARGKWLRAFLCSKPVQAVGLSSYGIYLWQQLFTAPPETYSGAGEIIPRLLPLLFLIVAVSYYFIEMPAIRFGKSLSQRRTTKTIQPLKPGFEVIR